MEAWARSGAMDLTGRPDGPALGPPEGLVPYLDTVARMIAAASEQVGDAVSIDPLQLLSERAAISGFTRRGPVSCGGGTRLLQAYDDWVGVSLTRGDDWDLVPAWLEVDLEVDGWDARRRDRRRSHRGRARAPSRMAGSAGGSTRGTWTVERPVGCPFRTARPRSVAGSDR